MQVIKTSGYGELTFIRTWSNGAIHIGKLKDGGYCHIGGPPIASETELSDAIPAGEQCDEALDWWKNKDTIEEKPDGLNIVIQKDGSYVFSDGSAITGIGDLVAHIPPGPSLDAATRWYVTTLDTKQEQKESDKEQADQETAENKEELAKRTCVCNFRAKRVINKDGSLNMTGLIAHQRTCKVYQGELAKAA